MKNSANRLPGLSEPARSTFNPRGMRSGAAWLASATPEKVEDFLDGLSDNALLALPWMFEFWAMPHQLPPDGAWKIMGDHGRSRRGQDPRRGGMGARRGRGGDAGGAGAVVAGWRWWARPSTRCAR